jgi:hypothetical protein
MEDTLDDIVMMFIRGEGISGVIGYFTLGRAFDMAIGGVVGSEGEGDLGGGRLGPNSLGNYKGHVFLGETDIVPVGLFGIVFIHKYLLSWGVPIRLLMYLGEQGLISPLDLQ